MKNSSLIIAKYEMLIDDGLPIIDRPCFMAGIIEKFWKSKRQVVQIKIIRRFFIRKATKSFYQFGQNITKSACDNDKIANIN